MAVSSIAQLKEQWSTTMLRAHFDIEVDFRGGSLRVGVMRLGGEAIAYVQTGDAATLALRQVWQVPATLYLSVADLASLANAVQKSSAKIQTLGPR